MLSQAWKMVGRSLNVFQFVGCAVYLCELFVLICLIKLVGAVDILSGVVGVLP